MVTRNAVRSISAPTLNVNEALLSVKDAASFLCVSVSWIYQSDIPYVKLGSRRVYRPRDLAAYIDSHVSHRPSTETL
jgi:hypothetical protein